MQAENRNLFLGMITGMLVGGAIALLMAPAEGREMRERLKKAADEARERAKEMTEKGREYAQEAKTQLQVATEEARLAAERKREELEKTVRART